MTLPEKIYAIFLLENLLLDRSSTLAYSFVSTLVECAVKNIRKKSFNFLLWKKKAEKCSEVQYNKN